MKLQIGSVSEPKSSPTACIIWMHGLGAQSDDMAMLAQELNLNDVQLRHVFLDAPIQAVTINGGYQMPAWYDITGDKITDREDESGILRSELGIKEIIAQQIEQGIVSTKIFLAGFSQGAAMALHTGIHYPEKLGGIIVLSGYLPLSRTVNQKLPTLNQNTPIFMAAGQADMVVRLEWALASKLHLENEGYKAITWRTYPMDHSVCREELQDLISWLRQVL